MTVTKQLPPLETIEFQRLKTSLDASPIDSLVKNLGMVYVTSITRDGCSGCAEQKPLFHELAAKMSQKHHDRVRFTNVHIRYQLEDQRESWEAKRAFGHAAYPTYMIHVRSHMGPLEVYRSVYPAMQGLEKQATDALELAEYYEKEANKA